MKIHEFLHHLNEKVMESNGIELKHKKKSLLKQQAIKLDGNIDILDRNNYPFKSLSFLGITECHISRKSLGTLQVNITQSDHNLLAKMVVGGKIVYISVIEKFVDRFGSLILLHGICRC